MVCVILPVLNEEKGLRYLLPKFKKYEVVVVDGHSTDRSVEIAKKFGAKVIVQEGKGKGMAFQTFQKKYKGKSNKFVMLDADGTYDPNDIPLLVKELDKFDVVIGKRKPEKGSMNFVHWLGNSVLNMTATILYATPAKDLCSGYWAFNRDFLKKARITAKNFELEANLFAETIKKKFNFKYVGVKLLPRKGENKLRWTAGFAILFFLLKSRFTS